MSMFDFMLACAAAAGGPILVVASYKVGRFIADRTPVEPEPVIDMDLFEAEMSMEAAVLEYRLANERRAEMVARAS